MIPDKSELIREIKKRAGVSSRKLATAFEVDDDGFDSLVDALLGLQRDGELVRVPGEGWFLHGQTPHRVGTIRITGRGHAFVRARQPGADDTPSDLFVPSGATGNAFDGDFVLVSLDRPRPERKRRGGGRPRAAGGRGRQSGGDPDRLPVARVVDIVERRVGLVRGRFRLGEKRKRKEPAVGFVESIERTVSDDIFIAPKDQNGALDGQKVLVRLLDGFSRGTHPRGEVVHVIADVATLESDFEEVAAQFAFPVEHPEAALEEARGLSISTDPEIFAGPHGREDLRGAFIFTIDPDDARDFDDAVSLEVLANGHRRLGVHIADVSHFVRVGSALDRSARERGTSIYLPGRVVHMLPERIANDLASLRPDEDRLSKSVFIDFDARNRVVATPVARTVIRSARRFTYDEVLAILQELDRRRDPKGAAARNAPKELPIPDDFDDFAEVIGRMAELRDALHAQRVEKGCLELELPAVRLRSDPETGDVIGIATERSDPSHQLIEEFMLAANEAVARYMAERDVPLISRVHDEPDESDLSEFFEFVEKVDGTATKGRRWSDLPVLLERVKDQPFASAVSMSLLRTLPHAEYSEDARGHFALAKEHYCHFTSPIRRYPDLIIHQVLDELLQGQLPAQRIAFWRGVIPEVAESSSNAERRAERAERDMTKLRLIRYLEGRVGEEMDGVIVGVHAFGFFVQEEKELIDGLVHVTSLGDYYEHDADGFCLKGSRTGRTFRLGDRVRVALAELNPDFREIRFEYVGTRGTVGGKKKKEGAGRSGKGRGKRRRES